MTQEQIEAIINDLFEDYPTVSGVTRNSFLVEFREHYLSFADLHKISEAFGTKNINMGYEERDDGYCDTCSSPYSVTVVSVQFEDNQ